MKQKIRKIVYVVLLTFVALLISNKVKAAEATVGGVTYTYDLVNGNAENVWISSDPNTSFTGAIPATLDGHPVTSIGDGTNNIFGHKDEGRIEAGSWYFPKLDAISNLEIPSTVTKINDYAFYAISTPAGYTLPSNLKTIGKYSFAESHCYSNNFILTIPDSVETIGEGAFSNVKTINGLISIHAGTDPEDFSMMYFRRVANKVVLGSGIQTIGDYAFKCQPGIKGDITIPSTTTSIGVDAFRFTGISKLSFADRTTNVSVGNYAFRGTALEEVVLKDKVSLGNGVFMGNTCLEEVTVPSTFTRIPDYTFASCKSLTSSEVNEIMSNAQRIGSYAFDSCGGLVDEVIIPSTVNSMGTGVFHSCINLEEATINAQISDIPNDIFANCTSLSNVTKSNSIIRIGNSAFSNCKSITTDELHDILTNVVFVGNNCFESCTGLTGTVTLNCCTATRSFAKCSNIEKLILKSGVYTSYIYDEVFKDCTSLKYVEFDGDFKIDVGDDYFCGCTSLTMDSVEEIINHQNSSIGDREFKDCTSIEGELHIPSNIGRIESEAFYNDTGITKIVFDNIDETNQDLVLSQKCFGNIATEQKVVYLPEVAYYYNGLNIGDNAFSNIEEAYVDMNGAGIPDSQNRWWGTSSNKPFIHYNDCTHNIDITCSIPGVSLVNPDTNETLSSMNVGCGEDFSFKLVVDEAHANSYPDLTVKIVSEGKFRNSQSVVEYPELNPGETYTFENVNRGKKIIVQVRGEGTDLVLRQFISQLNNTDLRVKRIPNINIANSGIIEYKHTKYPVIVKKNDLIKYSVRIYNEGETAGDVNELTVRIPDGLAFIANNETNSQYGWTVSEDGKTIKTRYLENETIEAYRGSGRPNYKEVEYVLLVAEDSDSESYMATLAEITEGNDIDSIEGSAADISLDNLMHDESYASSTTSYVHLVEDDTDYEDVIMEGKASTEYSLVINKVDAKTDELLNGAKFELLDVNEQLIKSAVTENGAIDFGSIVTYGEGTDTYYIREVETPVGYKKTIDGLMEISVMKKLNSLGELEINIFYDLDEIIDEDSINDSIDEDEIIIPISNQLDLSKIGTDSEVTIDGTTYTFSKDAHYKLVNNIEISVDNWPGIEEFSGTFDGDNHTISGLKININNAEKVGLFKQCSGTIMNLTIDNATVTGTTNVESPKIGIFVGYMTEGKIVNCKLTNSNITTDVQNVGGMIGHTKDIVKVERCSTDENTSISAKYNVGGIVGCSVNQIDVDNCTNSASVTGTDYNIGGIVGYADKAINVKKSSNNGNIAGEISTAIIDNNEEYVGCSNVGGIVGCVNSSSVINANECQNTGKVSGLNNIGGIVGFSEGVTYMTLCENSGEVTGSRFNVGGITGHVEPKGEASSQTMVDMDDDHVIRLYIRNKATQGKYLLNIFALDASNSEKVKLTGAKFSIYNANKEAIVENQEVDGNGNIKIDNNILNSLISDVFFIKEVEAPEGYEALVKDYIMLQVEKTWNAETEKYEISGVSQIVTNMDDVELLDNVVANANGEEMPNEAGSGRIVEREENQNLEIQTIYYKSTKAVFESCENSGKVLNVNDKGNGGLAGGIVGLARGFIEVRNCDNTSEVMSVASCGAAGGIVGDMSIQNYGNTSLVTGCSNTGKISGFEAGGIVGVTGSKITVEDSDNTGMITAYNYNAGGIIGNTYYNTTVTGCTNTGVLYGNYIGGIVGSSTYSYGLYDMNVLGFYIPNEYLRIEDCKVSNIEISADKRCGGIISDLSTTESYIIGCIIDNITVSAPGASAGIGAYNGAELTVEDVIVRDCKITGEEDSGGIVGGQYGWHGNGSSTTSEWDRQIYKFKGVQILGTQVLGGGASGIMSKYVDLGTYADICEIEFTDCYIGGSDNNERSAIRENGTYGHAAGMLGTVYGYHSREMALRFDNCTVENTDISDNNNGAAGIMGYVYELNGDISIKNCTLKTSTINATGDHVGGMFGGDYDCSNRRSYVEVDNCLVEDSTLSGGENNGAMIGEGYDRYALKRITNCTARNVTFNGGRYVGTMIGFIYGCNAEIEDCTIEGVDINGAPFASFGIGEFTPCYCVDEGTILVMKGITIKPYTKPDGTNKKCSINCENGSFSMGGLLGSSYYVQSVEVEDIDISDVEFNGPAHHLGTIGGAYCMVGGCEHVIFRNINISNIDIDNKDAGGSNVGGFMGFTSNHGSSTNDCIFEDININNVNIKNAHHKVGGFMGDSYICAENPVFRNIEIKNVNLEAKDGVQEIGGFIGNVYACGNPEKFENIKLSNIDIKTTGRGKDYAMASAFIGCISHNYEISDIEIKNAKVEVTETTGNIYVAGILGGDYGENRISGINIDGLTLINRGQSSNAMTGGIRAYARDGLVLEDSEVKNITITAVVGGAAGILGGGKATIKNVTVTNPNINTTGSMSYVGGIVGISQSESIIDNAIVTADSNSETTYKLLSKNIAAGIAAIDNGLIKNSSVSNITIQSTIPAESTVETDDDDIPESVDAGNSGSAGYIHGLFINECDNCTYENVTLLQGE